MTQVFEGHIEQNQGFDAPAPVAGLPGWTVNKQQQTEIFIVRHGLGLADPARLQITATADDARYQAIVERNEADEFMIRTYDPANDAPAMTGFQFRAELT
jgi:hypothetical protein